MCQHDPVGVIGVYWAERHQPLADEVELLQTLADTTATVLERIRGHEGADVENLTRMEALERTNAKLRAEVLQRHTSEAELKRLSLTDGLTGLYNRRGFYLLANPKLRAARREHQSATVLFIDVDYLKQVNDHYGHEAGDWLILGTAEALHRTFREEDVLARLGGDEFVVFVADCEDGQKLIDRLKANAADFVEENDLPYPLSFSVGLAHGQWHEVAISLNHLVSQADQAMYANKQRRRPLNIAEIKAAQRWGEVSAEG
jgi:diguanylate cyclase (GGDEF)-like protein